MKEEESSQTRLHSFHELMQHRVQRILLISSLYDSFIMSEEGHLHETLLGQFIDLNVSNVPDLVRVSSASEALEALGGPRAFDLVITSLHPAECDCGELTQRVRAAGHRLPIIALAYTHRELAEFQASCDTSQLERIFLWQGDVRVLMAMVTYLEDRFNVEVDTGRGGVPAILLVEDNIRYYSSFLPAIYAELYRHTNRLLSQELSLPQRMMRLRARPKVLLCDHFEEAWDYLERYPQEILGVVSDFEFPRGGKLDPQAGLELCRRAEELRPGIRLVMQSSDPANRALAEGLEASFLLKGSHLLLTDLQRILVERFGFGDFIFRRNGKEIGRAADLRSLREGITSLPPESLAYHGERNHFSNWLKARTEFELAQRLAPVGIEDFESLEDARAHLVREIDAYRLERQRSVIAVFERDRFDPATSITRMGGGSLGGKARGVAFANRILRSSRFHTRFRDVEVYVPPSVVLGTEVFDEFLNFEGLRDFALAARPDEQILQRFLEAPLPRTAVAQLRSFLQVVKYPLAVRSSSLLEDSISQPFAGVYQTFMLANNHPDLDMRWAHLAAAIKRVYASAFTEQAKGYLEMTSFRLEEEKMAVMVQELVGAQHGDRFYPDFAGVARSHNHYPEPGHEASEGVCAVALGLGTRVVGGSLALSFSPKHPRQIFSFSNVKDALATSQRQFTAIDLDRASQAGGVAHLSSHPLSVAEEDGTLNLVGSTYSHENGVIVDGIARQGVRLVSFAQVLKHGAFPLAEIIDELLERCAAGTGAPVEIEFAGNLVAHAGRRPRLAFLQLRPLALSGEAVQLDLGHLPDEELLCRSARVLGNGVLENVHDIVVVDLARFDRQRTPEVALEVARMDATLRAEGRPYLLVGPGRWGSSDPKLGVPVGWHQISGAAAIVEAGFEDVRVVPSQGTHFFQNLSCCHVGYFTVNPESGEGLLDWDWLGQAPAQEEGEFVRWLRFDSPVEVRMSGRTGEGVVLKPGAEAPKGH